MNIEVERACELLIVASDIHLIYCLFTLLLAGCEHPVAVEKATIGGNRRSLDRNVSLEHIGSRTKSTRLNKLKSALESRKQRDNNAD